MERIAAGALPGLHPSLQLVNVNRPNDYADPVHNIACVIFLRCYRSNNHESARNPIATGFSESTHPGARRCERSAGRCLDCKCRWTATGRGLPSGAARTADGESAKYRKDTNCCTAKPVAG